MSYISADLVKKNKKEEVVVWERTSDGRVVKHYKPPYYFYVPDEDGPYTSILGDKLAKNEFKNGYEFYRERRNKRSNKERTFEADVDIKARVLSQNYYNVEAPPLHYSFVDIEVDYNPNIGYAKPSSYQDAYAPINSIALDHYWSKERFLICVPPEGQDWDEDDLREKIDAVEEVPGEYEILLCEDEDQLLKVFVTLIEDSDVISGWNSSLFDVPYLGWRLLKMDERLRNLPLYPNSRCNSFRDYIEKYGDELKWFRKLDFPEGNVPQLDHSIKVRQKGSGLMMDEKTIKLSGRIQSDYILLFKKYEMAERGSYKLESIADEILPELPKLEYEGSLADLYRNDFPYFVRYNIRDTEILSGLEDKLGYLDLANKMCHISCGLFDHVTGTVKLSELAIINYCHHELNQQVPDREYDPNLYTSNEDDDDEAAIAGAFVLDPKVGMHDWIGSIDINSLYPSSIRALNISPEKIVGQFTNDVQAAEGIAKGSLAKIALEYEDQTKPPEAHTAEEWRKILWDNKWAVSGYGTVFNQDEKGIVPTILEEWYATRKNYQRMAKEEKDKNKSAYYDRLQYVYKIKLNSVYGALTNKYFKFFDLRMGESTTATGRVILLHQCAEVNNLLDGSYDSTGESVIYGDTDSSYFKTFGEDKEEAIEVADIVAERVNGTFKKFMQNTFLCQPEFDSLIKTGREIVASRGIFVKKKKYMLNVVDKEGKSTDSLKVMGLDTKRTTIPKEIGNELNKFIGRLLKGESWEDISKDVIEYKRYLRNVDDIRLIGLPKGVNKVEKYTIEYNANVNARMPGHVAAAIHYNLALKEFNDKIHESIISGNKIKVFYLTQKHGKFKSIALPTDINEVPDWFLEHYHVDRDMQVEKLIDNPLKNILTAIEKKIPTEQDVVVDDLLSF